MDRPRFGWRLVSTYIVLTLLVGGLLTSCGPTVPWRVTLIADGQEYVLQCQGDDLAVRDLLAAVGVGLGPLDRVEPDLYVVAQEGMVVRVTRVEERFELVREMVPFSHQTMRSEGVPEGERRLLQPGINGEAEITYLVVLEDGIEVSRQEVRRETVVEPKDEVVLVGVMGEVLAVPIKGTIVYVSGGNAWVMRESTDLRRNITGSGDLDARVFALSPDGSKLLFTRAMSGDADTPLNSLWLARTSMVGEDPLYLGVTGVVWAGWSPDGTQVAYSTAERTGGVPGWKANNDLWLLSWSEEGDDQEAEIEAVLPATAEIPYAWWGRTYAWSPDARYLAYAQANEVGVVDVDDHELVPLALFPSYQTHSQWAWVPDVTWSEDSYLLAFVAHEGGVPGVADEESPIFGLWCVSVDGSLQVRLAEEVGMWAMPNWSPGDDGLLMYGQAQSPRNSQDSRYEIFVMDRDGSNRRRLYPPEGMLGVISPDVAWSSDGEDVLITYNGNLMRVTLASGSAVPLTSDGQSSHPRWTR